MDKFKYIYNYKNWISLINEGLIHTYPIKTAIKLITRELSELGIKSSIDAEYDTSTIFMKGYSDSFVDKDIKSLIRVIATCGYFPSTIELYDENDILIKSIVCKGVNYTDQDYDTFFNIVNDDIKKSYYTQFTIESGFNKLIDVPNLVFHVTKSRYLDKILKIGLIPKSGNKKAYHHDRIYLGYDMNMVENLSNQFSEKCEYVLLEIDTSGLKFDSSGLPVKFYDDPDFSGNGCYFNGNIPPENIKVLYKFNN